MLAANPHLPDTSFVCGPNDYPCGLSCPEMLSVGGNAGKLRNGTCTVPCDIYDIWSEWIWALDSCGSATPPDELPILSTSITAEYDG